MKEGEFRCPGLLDELVLESLVREVVLVGAAIALSGAAEILLDLLLVVLDLNPIASVLHEAVLAQLITDAFEDRSAELSRILGCILCVPS